MMYDDQVTLPPFKQFKKFNTIILRPPQRGLEEENINKGNSNEPIETKKGLVLNDSKYEREIKVNLRQISNHHIVRFETICDDVILQKYETIYSQVVNYMEMLRYKTNNDFLHAMLINTDQNSSSFFEGLAKFLLNKHKDNKELFNHLETNKLILPKGESHFKDLGKLFQDLSLELDYDDDKAIPRSRLIVVGEIQRIDQINLNIFLKRLIEYDQMQSKQYLNILIFDVSYDPRNLLDKIKANMLSKMILHQVDNVPSKNIYKEVLYQYIYEQSNCLFIPNSSTTKIIIDYINNHQISISSFQHYFRFSIMTFFLMHSWDNDEYLLFSHELEQITSTGINDSNNNTETEIKKKKRFFKRKLEQIYKSKDKTNPNRGEIYHRSDIDDLVNSYILHFNNKSVFFDFYLMFENIIAKLSNQYVEEYELFDKYQFFFEFLQYDHINLSNIRSSRIVLLEKYFKKFPKEDYTILINDHIVPEYKKLINRLNQKNKIDLNLISRLTAMIEKLESIGNEDISNSSEDNDEDINNSRSKKIFRFKTTKEIFNQLLHWLELLFAEKIFDIINDFDRDQTLQKTKRKWINAYKNYFVFSEAVNPSLGNSIMNTLIQMIEEVKVKLNNSTDNKEILIKDKFDFAYIMMIYINCFKKLGSTFRLKLFFVEFMTEIEVSIDEDNSSDIKKELKTVFVYISYVFSLIGFFSKKKGMGDDVFMKNYFGISDYYICS